jgi:GH141 insertion domain
MVAGLLAFSARAAEIWVAPNGDDANPGTRERPLASPARALRLARELRRTSTVPPAGGVHVILCGGTYRLPSALWLRPEDSGTADSPTVIEAAPGERPVLSGGVAVGPWRRATEPIPGLPAAAAGEVWIAGAPQFDGGTADCRQLWVGDRKAIRARTPDDGAMDRLLGWDRAAQVATLPAAAVAGLETPGGVEMVLEQQWEIAILRLRTVRVAGAAAQVTFQQPESRIEFEHPWPQPILPPAGGGAFYLVGSIGFLDRPGEWGQTAPEGRIVYWPRAGEDLARDPVTVPALCGVVRVEGSPDRPVRYVQFRGVQFSHAAWKRPASAGHVPLQEGMDLRAAYKLKPPGTPEKPSLENQAWVGRMPAGVTIRNADHVVFARCRFEHLAASALDLATGVHDSAIEGCVFDDVGGNGVQLGSFQTGAVETHVPYDPSDAREVCARVRIADNLVTDCGTEDWGCVGIGIGYAREIDVEHNEVCDLPYTGISVGWGWTRARTCLRDNRIHANAVHDVARRLCDTAGIYLLSAQPGTVVSDNRIDRIAMSRYVDRPNHWFYLYTDEGSSFITLRDNWCPAERFLKNANGPGNVWERNGPMVPAAIRDAAGLEPAFRDLVAARPAGGA